MSESHTCPTCQHLTDISIDVNSGAYMIIDREFVGLSALNARLYCGNCGWELKGHLDGAVFDTVTGVVTAGDFIPEV